MNWTKEQREAIEYSGKNILLAAAAGSGKTAVLVQRIIEKILLNGTDVTELLVLTFTDAAAGEMRKKVTDAINAQLAKDPKNEHLRRQSLLVHSANISTVHSFCSDIIRHNIHLTNLPAEFSLVDENERSLMLNQALDRVMERYYANIDRLSSFYDLAFGYGNAKGDLTLREVILNLFNFSMSMAYPSKWLLSTVAEYKKVYDTHSLCGTVWEKALFEYVSKKAKMLCETVDALWDKTDKYLRDDHPYRELFINEKMHIYRLAEELQNATSYDEIKMKLDGFSFSNLPRKRAQDELEKEMQERVKKYRDLLKNQFGEIKSMFLIPEADTVVRIANCYKTVRTLKNIVITLGIRFKNDKRSKNYLDFGDLEHELMNLISDRNGNAKETAIRLREKYTEILVDEYQDTSNIQDTIFRLISRDEKNIFSVGDIKQSIYKFRNAVPELFLDKYNRFGENDESGHLIRLFKNFRSRENVIDSVNFIFRSVMSREVGDIDYTTDEYLVKGADYYGEPKSKSDFDTELIMLDSTEAEDNTEAEARCAAKRIQKLICDEKAEVDDQNGGFRPLQYRDIVILMRNPKRASPIFEQIFSEYGIPSYSDAGKTYLDTLEVQTAVSFLQIIDNPCQDIPLIGIMRCGLFGFTSDELAKIRSEYKSADFYDAVKFSAKNGNEKAKDFINRLDKLRDMSEYTGVDTMLWHIYHSYGFYSYVGSMNGGAIRQANLKLLFERATDFERSKMSGLFSFMNYIDSIRLSNKDLTPAKPFGSADNVVRIMSIHKSKGLEFPIVMMCGLFSQFNTCDLKKEILWHDKLGIALDMVNVEKNVRYPSVTKLIVKEKTNEELKSEEMRLLYVALTRAKERLILISRYNDRDNAWQTPCIGSDKKLLTAYTSSIRFFRDWIVAAFQLHPDAKELRDFCNLDNDTVFSENCGGLKVTFANSENSLDLDEVQTETTEENALSDTEKKELNEKLKYRYDRAELGEIPSKISVSEVKRRQSEDTENTHFNMFKNTGFKKLSDITATDRGTITHFILRFINEKEINSLDDLNKAAEQMVINGVLSEEQLASADLGSIYDFLSSPLGQRLKKATNVKKEFKFYMDINASEVFSGAGDEKILLQGTMDCFFEDENGLVLLDYKTDKVSSDKAQEYSKRYKTQTDLYKRGLENILNKKVSETYLYFLNCNTEVKM